jgi:murein L,D-transpeptidase YafK
VIDSFARVTRGRYQTACRQQKIAWPPKRLTLLAFKRERSLEVWGAGESGAYARLATYRIVAASGKPGPKRRQGDKQVPEGIYSLPLLNPNSSYHLSIKVGYPNEEDIANATIPLERMGGDIYIHGKDVSIGCLAIGDRGIEELFTLAALVPAEQRRIIIAPFDFRKNPKGAFPREAAWVHAVYRRIKGELRGFPASVR